MRTRMLTTSALTFILMAGTSLSQGMAQSSGSYLALGAGFEFQNEADLDGSGFDSTMDADTGFAGLFAYGYRYDPNWRTELEISYANADVDSISGGTDPTGDVAIFAGLANALYDFQTDSKFTPYVGLGLGLAQVDYSGVTPVGGSRIDDRDTALAFQGILGVAYDMGDGVSFTADYRHLRTTDLDLRSDNGTRVDADFADNRFMIGFRWSLGVPDAPAAEPAPTPVVQVQPEPAPAPEPAPEPVVVPNTYLVFFDWDSASLLPGSAAVVEEAAANAGKANVTRIVATGHADSSGSDAYNLRLSKRRAEAVKAALVGLGIPESAIDVQWKGEREPLVPTEDGIREPQNRRVVIDFSGS